MSSINTSQQDERLLQHEQTNEFHTGSALIYDGSLL